MKKMKKALVILAAAVTAMTMSTVAFAADLGASDPVTPPVETGDNGMATVAVLGGVALVSATTIAIAVTKAKKSSK